MKPSIQRNLALWSGLSCAALVGLVSIAVWWRMSGVLRNDLDQTLVAQAAMLGKLLEIDRGRVRFDPDLNPHQNNGLGPDDLVHVRLVEGAIVYQSRALQSADTFAAIFTPNDDGQPHWSTFSPLKSGDFRAVAIATTVSADTDETDVPPEAREQRVWVCVARPLAPLQQVLGQLRWALLSASLLALLATLLIGRQVARAGVRPIEAVAAAVDHAQPGQTHLALSAENIPIELEPVVTKTNALLQRIQEELARQRQLTADVAHDLRTPVAGVRTLLDVCLQKPRSPAEYAETLETARAALRRLTALLEDVLVLARLEAGVEAPRLGPVPLSEAFRAAVETVQPLAQAREVTLRTEIPHDLTFAADSAMLNKIVVNLLANAVEHTPARSTVTLSGSQNNGTVEIQVRDEGPGIPAHVSEEIFNRFVRLDAARSTNGHHGLGLPIARGLARKLGGDVRLLTQTGPGSCFAIFLPAGSVT